MTTENNEGIENATPENEFVVPAQVEAAEAAKAKAAEPEKKVEAEAGEKKDEPVTEDDPAKKAAAREAFYARRATRTAEDAVSQMTAMRAELEALKAQPRQTDAAEGPKAPVRPNPESFELKRWDPKYEEAQAKYQEDFEQYVLEKAAHTAREATAGNLREAQQTTEMASLAATADNVGKKGVAKYSDFEQVVQDALGAMPPSPQALQRLVKLENAEDVFYHLGQHPELLEKITAMEPMDQTLEFGKISARLASSAKIAEKTTQSKPTPTAPRGSDGKFSSEADSRYDKMLKAQQNHW